MGCRAELDALRAGAAAAVGGQPTLVVVEAAAGFGKTALLGAFVDTLTGWQQLRAAGDETEARLPFGLLDRLAAGREPHADPFAAGAALLHLLGDLQDAGPVAVLVDDAHWADRESLVALTFALRRLHADRVLTVLALRPEEAGRLPPGLLKLAHDSGSRIELTGLTGMDVRDLACVLGHELPTRRVADRLVEHTGGSPLHLSALLSEAPSAALRRTRDPLPAPRSLAVHVSAMLDACPADGRRLLEAAAVLGRPGPLVRAAAVAGVDEPLAALQDALATGLVEAFRGEDGWTVGFRHAVLGIAARGTLGPASLAALHERVAGVVGGAEALAHRVAAATGPDRVLVADLCAQSKVDLDEGRAGLAADRLLAVTGLTRPGPARDDLLLDAVDLLVATGEAAEAASFVGRLGGLPDTPKRQLVLARLAWLGGRPAEAEALARSAWERGHGRTRAAGAALIAQLHQLTLRAADAVAWAQRALAEPALPATIEPIMRGTYAAGLALLGRPFDGLRSLADLGDDPDGLPPILLDLVPARGMIRMMLDDLPGAYADLRACAPRPGWEPRPYRLVGLGWLVEVEYRLGRWDDALLHGAQAESLGVDTDQTWQLAFIRSVQVPTLAARGLWEEAGGQVAAAARDAERQGDAASRAFAAQAAVHLAVCRGDAEAVVAAAAPLRDGTNGAEHEPGLFTWVGPYCSALVTLGRLDEAQGVVHRAGTLARQRGRRSALAAVALIGGELAAARRDPAAARAAFEEAVQVGVGAAGVLDQARAHAAYGRFLRRAGSRRAAIAQLCTARETFAALRARPFLDRCDAELAACGARVAAPESAVTDPLTPQERAVTRLVCAGRTNREVAAELVLSVKTVGYHLGNAYAKLGVSSRTQLAARLAGDRA
ncbi:MAG TPA: LuxR C-terminal-related transcriptional regulator [Pseudonocardia sp.]|nr:LuxR C-terminal-related transcriptional regulator [Pseudonocardia sp.]